MLESCSPFIQVNLFADPIFGLPSQPSFSELFNIYERLPSSLQNINEGWGTPVDFSSVPLEAFVKLSSLSMEKTHFFSLTDISSINRLNKMLKTIEEFSSELKRPKTIDQVADYSKKLSLVKDTVLENAQKLVLYARSGGSMTEEVNSLVKYYKDSEASPEKSSELFESLDQFTSRIYYYKYLKTKEVSYLKGVNSLELLESDLFTGFILFHYAEQNSIAEDNKEMFDSLVEDGQHCIYVDCSSDNKEEVNAVTRIVKYKDSSPVILDYLEEDIRKRNTCIAKSNSVKKLNAVNPKTIPLKVTCPNSFNTGACQMEDCIWACDDCDKVIEFCKEDGHFYCGCGQSKPENFSFRCKTASTHGKEFLFFTELQLQTILKQMSTFGEKNILILGETGVGKSTFINTIANSIVYSSLPEALYGDPICVIPSRFAITNQDMEQIFIQCGEPDEKNESSKVGESCTQFQKLTSSTTKASLYEKLTLLGWEIHGIIIMLKPNNNKLNVIFKYCIGELLTHLHKNAAANIVFCFTNTSGNDFQPGDAIVPLKEYLKDIKQKQLVDIAINKDTVYCMDNEAFRYLWAVKSGVKFNEEAHEKFCKSWRKSAEAITRMLRYICELEPHRTGETISLNEARRIILTFAQPIAKITQTIQSNITQIHDKELEISSLDVSSKNFKSKLMIPRTSIVHEMLNHPRTVCIADKHTEVRKDISGRPQILYKTHCHSHCYLSGVAENTPSNPDLQRCEAMHGSLPYCNVSEKQSCEIDRSTES
uniref:G domain-containing protein n=1 Tax=Ditylenchus dipsaci TaxID=166011 RepID=A0A915E558_9BILA